MSVLMTIDGRQVTAAENATILEAASAAGIKIPSLCFLKDCNKVAACRMCVVEVKGARTLMPACSVKVRDGMEVRTDTPEVVESRRRSMDLIFRHHNTKCEYCSRYSDCELHAVLRSLGMNEHLYETGERARPDESTRAIVRDNSKCITCRRCVAACGNIQGVGVLKAFRSAGQTYISTDGPLSESGCTLCGACVQACPTGALSIYSAVDQVSFALRNPRGRKLVAVVSPESARAVGTPFFEKNPDLNPGKLITALRLLGFDAVCDRSAAGEAGFCPAVLRYAGEHYPELADGLYSDAAMRPLTAVREAAAGRFGLENEDIYLVSVTPCTAEKGEEGFADAVLTTVETADLIRRHCVSRFTANEVWSELEEGTFDVLTAPEPASGARPVLGLKAVAEALEQIKGGQLRREDVALWACPGGCAMGGGQPRTLRSGY